MEYSGIHNRNISTAGDSATGDPSSSTCYGGVCMQACSQMVLDRWLLIFGWLFLFVCTFFCVFSFFYMYVFPCLSCLRFSCVFVMVESACQRARRWSWTGGSWYLVGRFFFSCLFLNVFLFVSLPVFMCWLFLLCFVFVLVESEGQPAGRWFWTDCVPWLCLSLAFAWSWDRSFLCVPWRDLY